MQIININILTLLFLYNSIVSIGHGEINKPKPFKNPYSHKTQLKSQNICKVLKKIEHSITDIDKIIENIIKYSTKGESINRVLKRIGSKKFKNSILRFKNSIKLTLYKEKIAKISEVTNQLKIQPDLLGKLFSNFIFDGDSFYCKNIVSIGYTILRLIGHYDILDYNELKIFLKNLFFHLVSKGFGINSYNKTRKYISLNLAKKLYVFLANFILNTDIKLIESYWEFKIQKIENIDELVENLFSLFSFHLNFLKMIDNGSISNNFLASRTKIEKWFMLNKDNFLNKDFFFQMYSYYMIINIKKSIKNTDLIEIEKILKESLKDYIENLNSFTGKNINYLRIFSHYTYIQNIFNQDWILNLSYYIDFLDNDTIKYYLKPYKKFINIHAPNSLKEGSEFADENEDYVVQNKKKENKQRINNEEKKNDFDNKYTKLVDVDEERKIILDSDKIKKNINNEERIKISKEEFILKKSNKFSNPKSEETPTKLIKL